MPHCRVKSGSIKTARSLSRRLRPEKIGAPFSRKRIFSPSSPAQLCSFLLLLCVGFHVDYVTASVAGSETLIGIVGKDFVLLGADSSISQSSISLTANNVDKIALVSNPQQVYHDEEMTIHNDGTGGTLLRNPQQQQTIGVAAAGDSADTDRLVGILQAHAAIREYSEGVGSDVVFIQHQNSKSKRSKDTSSSRTVGGGGSGMTVQAAAYLARYQIMKQLRSPAPLRVNLLLGGMMRGKPQLDTSPAFQVQSQLERVTSPSFHTPGSLHSQRSDSSAAPYKIQSTEEDPLEDEDMLQPSLFWLDEYGAVQQLRYGVHGFASNFLYSILDQGYRTDLTRKEAYDLLQECFAQLRTRYVINSPQPPCIKCIDRHGATVLRERDMVRKQL